MTPRDSTKRHEPRVIEVTRGDAVESRHVVHAAVSDGTDLVAAFGDPDRLTHYRSAAKAFQAWPLVVSGAADHFSFGPREIAVACGSHSGTAVHTATVAGMLSRCGLGAGHLLCGKHVPFDEPTAAEMAARGEAPSALHHNCSGKHAGMLARCVHQGWPVGNYIDPAHPHQVEIRAVVAAYAGIPPGDVHVAIDGCSAPVFAVPLVGIARSFARLARALGPDGNPAPAMARIRDAMRAHPEMVGGPDRLDTDVMTAASGDYVVKIGAEAVYGVGRVSTGLGLAFRIEDGGMRAVGPALADLLRALEWPVPPGLERHFRPPVTNYRDLVVGEIRPARS